MVQEYERAVIFRLGRLLNGGAKGPGEEQSKQSPQKDLRIGQRLEMKNKDVQGHLFVCLLYILF